MSSNGQAIGAVVGGVVGFVTAGPGGAFKGATYGAAIGGALDPPPGPDLEGPRLDDLSATTSSYGAPVPHINGTAPSSGSLIWVEGGKIKEVPVESETEGKGGGGASPVTSYEYFLTGCFLLADHEVDGIGRLWFGSNLVSNGLSDAVSSATASGELFPTLHLQTDSTLLKAGLGTNPSSGTVRLYPGYDDQPADPRMAADLGAGNCPAYRGYTLLFVYDYPLKDFGNSAAGLQPKAELIRSGNNLDPVLLASQTVSLPFGSAKAAARYLTPDQVNISQPHETSPYGDDWQLWEITTGGVTQSVGSTEFTGGDDAAQGLTDAPVFPVSRDVIPGASYRYPTGRMLLKNDVYYGADYGDHRVYRGSASVAPGYTLHAVTADDSGNIYAVGENTVKIYDEDLVELSSHSFNVSGESYSQGRVHVNWDNGFLYFAFGLNQINSIYIVLDDLSYQAGRITLPSRPSADSNSEINVVNNIAIRFTQDTVTDEASVEWYRLPTLNVGGQPLADVARERMEQSVLIEPDDIDVTLLNDTVSYLTQGITSIRSAVQPLMSAFGFDVIESGYQIKCVPRGQSPVMTIDYNDLDARPFGAAAGVAIDQQREMDSQLPKQVFLDYLDSGRNYNKNQETSIERLASQSVNIESFELAIVFSPDEAAERAQTVHDRRWLERDDFAFVLPQTYNRLEPTDVVDLPTPYANYELRLTSVNGLADGRIEVTAKLNDSAVYVQSAEGGTRILGDTTVPYAGRSVMHLLDTPLIRDEDNRPGFAGALSGKTDEWPGGTIVRSVDSGQTWKSIQGFTSSVTAGVCRNSLPQNDGYVIDRTNTLTIDMYNNDMTLSSISQAQMLTGMNWFAYGINGRVELCRYANATLNTDGSYTLDTLIRGAKGTEWATGLHVDGDLFVFLSDKDMAFVAANVSDIGIERLYRGVTKGKSIDSVTDTAFSYSGANLKPLNPVQAVGAFAGGTLSASAKRRSRLSNNWWTTGVQPSLGEVSEAYEMDVLNGATVVRTITGTFPLVYTSTQQVEDFGSLQNNIEVNIYPMSDTVGRGFPLNAVFANADILDISHPGLIAMYTMDDIVGTTIADETPNGNDATINGGATAATGKFGNALDLDGTDDWIDCGAPLLPATGDWGVAIWINVASLPGSEKVLFSQYEGGDNARLLCRVSPSTSGLVDLWIAGTSVGSALITAGVHNLVVLKREGGNIGVSVNGADFEETTFSSSNTIPSVNTVIGRHDIDAGPGYIDGLIDQVRIYDFALSNEQASKLYNE